MAVRDLQIHIQDRNAIVKDVETDQEAETPCSIMETKDMTVSKDTTSSIPKQTDVKNSSSEIVAVVDVHVDALVVEGTNIHDEPTPPP